MWDSIGSLIPSPFFQFTESTPSPIGLITLGVKPAGKRSAANLHAPFDVAGDGNLAYAVAPFLDPTCEGNTVELSPTYCLINA